MSLAPSDSTQAMASLMSAYTDDDADEEIPLQPRETAGVEKRLETSLSPDTQAERTFSHFISDDEDHHSSPPHDDQFSPTASAADRPVNKRLNVAALDQSDQNTRSPIVQGHTPLERKPTLVSYVADDEADDDMDDMEESEHSQDSLPGIFGLVGSRANMSRVTSAASVVIVPSEVEASNNNTVAATSSPRNAVDDDVRLPPEPPGSCSKRLQEKIAKYYDRVRAGKDLNLEIQRRKDFRNPSIYDKLVQFCAIDDKGTNYPPELYNPLIWGAESYYDELAKVQMEYIHKKEKESNKSKVEFQKGVKKTVTTSASDVANNVNAALLSNASTLLSATDAKQRKSKWDERGVTSSSSATALVKPK